MTDTPAHSLDAERAVLGAILLLGEKALGVLAADVVLRPEHFYREQHATIYAAMLELADQDRALDSLTLTEHLKATGRLAELGDDALVIDEYTGWVPMAGSYPEYGRLVVEHAMWRSRREAAIAMLEAVGVRDQAAFDTAESLIASSDRPDDTTSSPGHLRDEMLDWLVDENPDAIPTPFEAINGFLSGGLRRGDVTLIAGFSSHGKSLAIDGFLEFAARVGVKAHLYINEMSKRDRTARTIAARSGVRFGRILNKTRLNDVERQKVIRALREGLPFGATDCAGWSGQDISRHIRRHRWDIAGVDLLHLIPHETVADLDAISRQLNAAARQAGCHLLVACQLNMERYKTAKAPRPVRRDIRGSGQLFNDAANVLFIHRDQVKTEGTAAEMYELLNTGSLYLEKARNGQLGGLPVVLNPDRMRFEVQGYEDGVRLAA